jgi:hypothetical protein
MSKKTTLCVQGSIKTAEEDRNSLSKGFLFPKMESIDRIRDSRYREASGIIVGRDGQHQRMGVSEMLSELEEILVPVCKFRTGIMTTSSVLSLNMLFCSSQ